MNPAVNYTQDLANSLTKIDLVTFFKNIRERFYSTQDISFMEFFLELTDHEGEFYIHHNKLVEYGAMTSSRSSNAKDKLDHLGLIENSDYLLLDIQQNSKAGGRPSKMYYLTPEAFKKCLMRARRYKKQSVDPVIYCNYYLLLEKVFKLFTDYEKAYWMKLNSMKDNKIDGLTEMNQTQMSKIDELLNYAKDTNEKLDALFDFMVEFVRMTVPMWVGSSVFMSFC
jgi:hypothetical protein